jgi:putative endonuclease
MMRSAVRSRLAPPAFARFASYGSASHAGLSCSEVSEGCRAYILESFHAEHFCVGIADDVPARLAKHNSGEVPHTSKFRPWRLKTYIAFTDEKKAFAFERYLKSGSGRALVKKGL